jgi:hypothetical protein
MAAKFKQSQKPSLIVVALNSLRYEYVCSNVNSNLIRYVVSIYIDIKIEIDVQPLHLNTYLS